MTMKLGESASRRDAPRDNRLKAPDRVPQVVNARLQQHMMQLALHSQHHPPRWSRLSASWRISKVIFWFHAFQSSLWLPGFYQYMTA
jgi:hypothetical protein